MVLAAERVSALDVQHLADVSLRVCPDQLVAPGLLHAAWLEAHLLQLRPRRSLDRIAHAALPEEDRHRRADGQPPPHVGIVAE
jgi:hypothetical protein